MSALSMLDLSYPTNDGKPMSENTVQFEWIVKLQGGLDAYYANTVDVFVAGDLLWYPVEGDDKIRQAPDAMVVFGRPKGHRGSYMQWREAGIAPQVVFEVLSPGNRPKGMKKKLKFYRDHGVEEYYIYKPDVPTRLQAYQRGRSGLREVKVVDGMRSPRLGLTFDLSGQELVIRKPDGSPLLTYLEQDTQRQDAVQRAENAERELAELRKLLEQRNKGE